MLDYREVFERSVVGVAVARLDGTFISVNPAFARIFGYEAPEQFIAAVGPDVTRWKVGDRVAPS